MSVLPDACCFSSKVKCSMLTKCLSHTEAQNAWQPAMSASFPFLGAMAGFLTLPPMPPRQHVIYGNWKTSSKQAQRVPEVVEEYLCDKFTGSLEDPLIFWEMTRRLWPCCVKFPLLYRSYMPWTIYPESEGIFTIQATSQAVKEIYSE